MLTYATILVGGLLTASVCMWLDIRAEKRRREEFRREYMECE
jgi:hypothetical protein